MFDFTGTRFDFTACSSLREIVAIRFCRAGSTEGVDLSGAAFACRATERMTGTVLSLPVEYGSETCSLLLTIPELRADEYEYELYATDAEGDVQRVLYGTLTAVSMEHAASLADSAKQSAQRTLLARMPEEVISPLELRWSGSSVAQKAAQDAADSARKAQVALDEMEQVREEAEAAVNQAQEALGKLNTLDAKLAEVEGRITSAIVPNPETNTWWICGSNTGYQVTGDPGKSPRLSAVGTWMIWNVETQEWDDTGFSAAGEDGHSPYVNAAGHWCTWNVLTGEFVDTGLSAAGKDGLDGVKVRRVLVANYEEIPQSGETCNGGFLYYVPAGVERCERLASSVPSGAEANNYNLTGPMVFSSGRTWTRRGGALRRLGVVAGSTVSGGEPSDEALYAHVFYETGDGEWTYAGHSANAVAQRLNETSWWDFEELEPAPGECRVKLVMSRAAEEPTDAQAERIRVRVEAVAATEGSKAGTANYCAWVYWAYRTQELQAYDVYAWVEGTEEGGGAGWVRVDENYDLATAEIYGLVRLGFDRPVVGGAPVGNDVSGQMSVPHADYTTPGTVRPATADVLARGGAVGFDAEGRMVAQEAAYGRFGTMKPSTSSVPGTWCVGINSDGTAGVVWASLNNAGVVKLGSRFGQSNPIPYQQGVGATEDHKLVNNLVFGGALQHQTPTAWSDKHMDWLDTQMSETPEWFGDMYYLGLMTSGQFTQSQVHGLELESATTSLLAGVFLASSMTDERGNAVPGAAMVLEHLNEHYYNKSQVYTKEEVDTALNQYVTRTYADATFATKSELNSLSEAVIHKTEQWEGDLVVTEEEYNGMSEHNPKIKYYIV